MDKKPDWMPHWLWKARDEVTGAAVVGVLGASIEPIWASYQERPPNIWGAWALFSVTALASYLYFRAFKHGLSVRYAKPVQDEEQQRSASLKQVPHIDGSFSQVLISRCGLVTENRIDKQTWMVCGFKISVSLRSSESVCIQNIRVNVHSGQPMSRSLSPLLPTSFMLEKNVSHTFQIQPQFEFLYSGQKELPSSFELIATDELGAEHPLRLTGDLPLLPETQSEDASGLQIVWKPGEIKYYMYYGAANLALHYRVLLKNKSKTEKLKNVRIELKSLDPDNLPCVPCSLRLMNDLVQGTQRFIEIFELKPQEERFVDVMAQDPNGADLYIWHTVRGISEKVSATSYRMVIVAKADGVADEVTEFQLYQNGPYWSMRELPN